MVFHTYSLYQFLYRYNDFTDGLTGIPLVRYNSKMHNLILNSKLKLKIEI